jgi:hypothetical protein
MPNAKGDAAMRPKRTMFVAAKIVLAYGTLARYSSELCVGRAHAMNGARGSRLFLTTE